MKIEVGGTYETNTGRKVRIFKNDGASMPFRDGCGYLYTADGQCSRWTLVKRIDAKFNLKTQPWYIRTETPDQRIAAQEWLFENGMEWYSGGQIISTYDFAFITNTMTNGVVCKDIMCGRALNDSNTSAQEIKLTYKTTVTDVIYPEVETERDKELKAIRADQESVTARLKAWEAGQ